MTHLIGSAAADAAASALYRSFTQLEKYLPGAYSRHGVGGTQLRFTTIPIAEFNTVSVDREWDPSEVEAFAQELSATGVPWSIQTRGEPDSRLVQLGARYLHDR